MDTTLPTGHPLRAPTGDDAAAVAALLRARELADLGTADVTVDDVRADWEAPGVRLHEDARVVEDGDGALVGYGLVSGGDLQVVVHPEAEGSGLGTELRQAAEGTARAQGTRVVRQFVPTANTAARVLLLDAGWWPVHHYFRMHIALKHAPQPPDVLTRTFDANRDTEEVWHLMQGAYSHMEGYLPQSLEGWRASGIDKPGWDPALWVLAHDAKGIVGAALGEKEKRTGVVTAVAVANRARGRGHGRSLLLLLLAAFRTKRLWQAEAAVHGSTAAAARLFESVGMTAARQSERWEKILGV
jgi:mycothiol synthase